MSTREAAAHLSLELARDQLVSELSGADSDDVKSLGFLAFDVAAPALVVTVRSDLDRFWWAIVAGLAISAVLLVGSVWRRKFETGPAPEEFYASAEGMTDPETVTLVAMQGIVAARLANEEIRRATARWYVLGLVALFATAGASGILLWQVH